MHQIQCRLHGFAPDASPDPSYRKFTTLYFSPLYTSDCMNFFHFLPVRHQIDIRTAKFMENFMCSENYICISFESKADANLKEIFPVRGNTMSLQF